MYSTHNTAILGAMLIHSMLFVIKSAQMIMFYFEKVSDRCMYLHYSKHDSQKQKQLLCMYMNINITV